MPRVRNQISMHENDFWTPELLFRNQAVYIIGGGPTVNDCDLSLLCRKNVIAVNSSASKVFDAKIENALLYFTDSGWWRKNEDFVRHWPGKIVTLSGVAKREFPEKILRVEHAQPSENFPDIGSSVIRWGRSSGHTAISLAVAMGATIIVLVGYDMKLIDGLSHHHLEYPRIAHPNVYGEFIEHFNTWNQSANDIGVKIFNASPNSDLNEFEKIDYSLALHLHEPDLRIAPGAEIKWLTDPNEKFNIETEKSVGLFIEPTAILDIKNIETCQFPPDEIPQTTKFMNESSVPVKPARLSSWLRRK